MDPAVPFGGYEMSSYGRESGVQHQDEYLNVKSVWIKTAPALTVRSGPHHTHRKW